MAKPEWGAKRICPSCGVRFYDLTNDPCVCPSCSESFALAALTDRKSAQSASAPAKAAKAKAKPAAPVADDDDDVVDDDSDDDLAVDEDVLLDDDEDDDDELGIETVAEKDDEET